jgi:hypothetical protein
MAYTSVKDGVGDANNLFKLSKANRNYSTAYFEATISSGDVRDQYRRVKWTNTGGGEVLRIYAQTANAAAATGGTINGIHATLDIYSGAISGTASAIRATIASSASLTPGGTTSALFLSGGLGATNTITDNCSFIHVNDTGGTAIPCFVNFDASITVATDTPTSMVSTHADHASTHLIRCQAGGAALWLMATNAH